ncbi:MAG TPA: hypothetical protein VHY21_08330 [Pseudonocardiaceae bacterium]|jgi:hypothetical protein|nr:hypothetical protein [Pseudonocardiaceae bacterium]
MKQRAGLTPLGAVVRGAAAGAVGTIAMDLLWFSRYKRNGGDSGFVDWEFAAGLNSWDGAPAPAQFGRRLIQGVLQRDLPPERARLVNNVVHWATGVGWSAAFGLVSGSLSTRRGWHGLILGAGVWAQSYAVLVPAKLYKPIWEYDAETLWKDLSAHLVYGLATATTFRVLAGR